MVCSQLPMAQIGAQCLYGWHVQSLNGTRKSGSCVASSGYLVPLKNALPSEIT